MPSTLLHRDQSTRRRPRNGRTSPTIVLPKTGPSAKRTSVKILIVTWFFPPENEVAALRTGALAEFLHDQNHDVHVLTRREFGADRSLRTRLPSAKILRSNFVDVDHPLARRAPGSSKSGAQQSKYSSPRSSYLRILRTRVSSFLEDVTHIPDRRIGWLPYAVAAGGRLMERKRPDLIYSSGPPFTCHLIAKALAARFDVPWVAEYRDAWCHYLYGPRPLWRQRLDEKMERATTSTASGIVALTDPWAEHFRERFGKPTVAIYNGYDAEALGATEPAIGERGTLTITYCGVLYGQVRDPSALYAAIRESAL
jgi:hypothetical protein